MYSCLLSNKIYSVIKSKMVQCASAWQVVNLLKSQWDLIRHYIWSTSLIRSDHIFHQTKLNVYLINHHYDFDHIWFSLINVGVHYPAPSIEPPPGGCSGCGSNHCTMSHIQLQLSDFVWSNVYITPADKIRSSTWSNHTDHVWSTPMVRPWKTLDQTIADHCDQWLILYLIKWISQINW